VKFRSLAPLPALIVSLLCICSPVHPCAAYTFTTLNDPLGVNGTTLEDISGNNIVGYYTDSANIRHGFIYNGSTFTTLDDPLATGGTEALGISGNTIVGDYFVGNAYHGFIYDGSSFTTLDDPLGTVGTAIVGLSGSTIVGYYDTSSTPSRHGFSYTAATFTTIDDPSGTSTSPTGISNGIIVGSFDISAAFKYDGSTFTTINFPGEQSFAEGVSGNLIVGVYIGTSDHGYLYDGSNYTTLDDPLGTFGTFPLGIDGTTVVGAFDDNSNRIDQGFIVTVPEPACLSIACLLGSSIFLRRRAAHSPRTSRSF
jgi:hypothetical protein